jgi:hypothetical protein
MGATDSSRDVVADRLRRKYAEMEDIVASAMRAVQPACLLAATASGHGCLWSQPHLRCPRPSSLLPDQHVKPESPADTVLPVLVWSSQAV